MHFRTSVDNILSYRSNWIASKTNITWISQQTYQTAQTMKRKTSNFFYTKVDLKRKLFKHFLLMEEDLSKNCSTGCNFFPILLVFATFQTFRNFLHFAKSLSSLIEAETEEKDRNDHLGKKGWWTNFKKENQLQILTDERARLMVIKNLSY